MKRRKDYMPRRGMHFDRRHVEGTPDAGFIGADIEVTTLTGSVMPSLEQRYSAYEITNRPKIIGYPRDWLGMFESTFYAYNSGVTRTWGHGFDLGGAVSYTSNFVPNGGGAGIDSWNFTAFTSTSGGPLGIPTPSTNWDMGGAWKAFTSWKGVPTFITASSFGSSLGPRGFMDAGRYPAVSGSVADVDYALRLMTTSSFLYTPIPNFYAGGYGRATVTVFKYTDATASFDIHAYGRPGDELSSTCLSVVTGSTLRWAATSSTGFAELTVPVEPNTWYISLNLNSNLASGPRVWLGVIPFWGGAPRITAWESFIHLTNQQTASYIGDCNFFGASDTLHIAALYMGATGIAGIGNPIGPEFSGALGALQSSLSAESRTKFKSTNAIGDSLTAFGTDLERRYLDQKLLGLGTGGLGRSFGVATIVTGSIPSWTNSHIRNSAFVSTTLSSSNHESQVLNAYRSGTEPLETTAVPASTTIYYSKRSTYNKVIAKTTASFFTTVLRPTVAMGSTIGEFVPSEFTAGLGAKLNLVTGSQYGEGITVESYSPYPAHVYIDVPVSGKLIDIAVWVELHHVSSALSPMPLGSLSIALKSPGINPGSGQPFANNDALRWSGATGWSDIAMYNNTFILWEGLGSIVGDQRIWITDGTYGPDSVYREKFPCWDRDLSMRTVFHDGAAVHNPRHNLGMHGSGNYAGSPNSSLGINSAWGMAVYWTGSTGSPPNGWLTGPGGVAAENEWGTTGSNRGASYLKPVYPMLDSIEVTIAQPGPGVTYPSKYFGREIKVAELRGERKGLRGTEISGTWKLLFTYSIGDDLAGAMDLYFRQARLEITYESNEEMSFRRNESDVSANRAGRKLLWEVSGAGPSGIGPSVVTASNYVFTGVPTKAEIGRTFGVVLNTGSIGQSKHALVYRLTGTLADYSGSAPGWLLNNRFGMPAIPLSSASLAPASSEDIVSIHPQDILTVRPLLDGAQRLSDAARDASPPQTRAQYAVEINSDDDTDE